MACLSEVVAEHPPVAQFPRPELAAALLLPPAPSPGLLRGQGSRRHAVETKCRGGSGQGVSTGSAAGLMLPPWNDDSFSVSSSSMYCRQPRRETLAALLTSSFSHVVEFCDLCPRGMQLLDQYLSRGLRHRYTAARARLWTHCTVLRALSVR